MTTKLFQYEEVKEVTEEQKAIDYDNALETYKNHIDSNKQLNDEFHRIGETAWIISEELRKANFVYGSTSFPEKRHIFNELINDRQTLLKKWEQKEVEFRTNISEKFYNFIGDYLSEIDLKIAEIQKTLAVSHLQKVRLPGRETLGTLLKTNYYTLQAAINYLKSQRSELEGMLSRKSSAEILEKVKDIGENCPAVVFEEKAVTALEMEWLQEATNFAMDMRDDNLVPADSTSKTIPEIGIIESQNKKMGQKIQTLKEKTFEAIQKAKAKEAGF
jgi:hypothetical protein